MNTKKEDGVVGKYQNRWSEIRLTQDVSLYQAIPLGDVHKEINTNNIVPSSHNAIPKFR